MKQVARCRNCSTTASTEAKYCSKCGTPLHPEDREPVTRGICSPCQTGLTEVTTAMLTDALRQRGVRVGMHICMNPACRESAAYDRSH